MDHKLWDDLAIDYDKSVEDNQNPIISRYLQKEIEILTSICKNISDSNKNCSIIDMGAGTGRVIFALDKNLQKPAINFFGVEISESMLNRANQKNQTHKGMSDIKFLKFNLTESNLFEHFELDVSNIVMCLYNTLGVIPAEKRQMFVDNMRRIAGDNGITIITAFNGDNFGFVAPKLYNPMIPMIRQINEDSFDEKNKIFQNGLGFRSQWFTKDELKSILRTEMDPIPIDVTIDGELRTLGNIFVDRKIK
tara:strand:- start:124 stop:873 length:750 start_codon:yes stop_codon:yes gene_type:complete